MGKFTIDQDYRVWREEILAYHPARPLREQIPPPPPGMVRIREEFDGRSIRVVDVEPWPIATGGKPC